MVAGGRPRGKSVEAGKSIRFIENFIRDIKKNGIGYIKSTTVVNDIKKLDPDIQIVWNKEDRTYTAYYNKDYKDDIS